MTNYLTRLKTTFNVFVPLDEFDDRHFLCPCDDDDAEPARDQLYWHVPISTLCHSLVVFKAIP